MRYGLMTAVALVVGIANLAHSETIRGGSWLVDASVTVEELVRQCGEPSSKRFEEQDVRVRSPNDLNSNTRNIGTTVVDGKIRSIERIK